MTNDRLTYSPSPYFCRTVERDHPDSDLDTKPVCAECGSPDVLAVEDPDYCADCQLIVAQEES